MLIKNSPDIRSSEITDEKLYNDRRKFLKTFAAGAVGFAIGGATLASTGRAIASMNSNDDWHPKKLSPYDTKEKLNSFEEITTYNNYYEFGTDKEDPAQNAKNF